mmetsp:Transcript_5957/g.10760  ORF Transcript_5957/g.10760 Transcript_5957/m.10760 type:complete len:857 (-) Transcript_5957:849-3419(-)
MPVTNTEIRTAADYNDEGLKLNEQLRYEEAFQLFTQGLQLDSRNADLLHNLGNCLKMLGRMDEAIVCLNDALDARPNFAEALSNLGNVYLEMGRMEEAIAKYNSALDADPYLTDAYNNLGSAYKIEGDWKTAESCYRKALSLNPDHHYAHSNLGAVLLDQGMVDEAIVSCQTSIRLSPTLPDAFTNLGCGYKRQGKLQRAVECWKQALGLNPKFENALNMLGNACLDDGLYEDAEKLFAILVSHYPQHGAYFCNLGIAVQGTGNLDAAITRYTEAISLCPSNAVAHGNLANCLREKGRFAEAETHYLKAIECNPSFADAESNYGNLLKERGRTDEAIEQYKWALRINPAHADGWNNLASSYKDIGKIDDAIAAYRKALRHRPGFPIASANLAHCFHMVCNWQARDELLQQVYDDLAEQMDEDQMPTVQPHHALVYPLDPQLLVRLTCCYARNIMRQSKALDLERSFVLHAHNKCNERLRIGYVSSDFGEHPLTQLMQSVFAMHDHTRFEVFGYGLSPTDGSTARCKVEEDFEQFHDVHDFTTLEIATLVNTHKIHILVDLNGYTKGARTELFALRPAAIQVSYLGYPGTMGADFIDYLITDHVASPSEFAHLYTEKLARMPHSYFVNNYRQKYPLRFLEDELHSRAELGLPKDKFIFACFNQLYKIDPGIFDVWMRILEQTPNSILWLLQFPASGQRAICRAAEAHGIPRDRVVFTEVRAKEEYLRGIHNADLVLDTPMYNGHTSSCDVLWAGIPIITLPGDKMASRVCASLLTALECTDTICLTLQRYEELAVHLASAAGATDLQRLCEKVRCGRATAPLFDTQLWVRNIEVLYTEMARRHSEGLSPEHISFHDL